MNVSELARKLRVSPNTLLDTLPKMGFDIGRKAIKIDDRVAQTIIRKWSSMNREIEQKEKSQKKQAEIAEAIGAVKVLTLPPQMTVRELAQTLHLSVPLLMTELMKSGILASVNERIDFETAAVIAEDLGFKVEGMGGESSGEGTDTATEKLKEALKASSQIIHRAPIVVVMGHVDHGKTTLLDAIRRTNVVAGEAGGITQHIGAYQVEHDGHKLTFIDTPGHEAFRAMRSRGAKVADIGILVVAADDGIKPQTKEALTILQGAGLPFVVAINKIDKPDANLDRVKQDLSAINLLPEDWGGKTICVPISAKAGQNLDKLLEMVLLVAELNQDTIVADPGAKALGTVIEARVDQGEGPVATILIQNGTLKVSDIIVHGDVMLGKVRALKGYKGETVTEAGPSMPVRIIGLKAAPEVGDILEAGDPKADYKAPEKKKLKRTAPETSTASEDTEKSDQVVIPVIIRADVLGSLEAIMESLAKLEHPEVRVQIIGKGLGNITEGDVVRASAASEALIAGFNVQITKEAQDQASELKVEIKQYNVIYDFLDEIKERMSAKLSPEVIKTAFGKGKVLAIFRQEPKSQIIGARITEGLVREKIRAALIRGTEVIAEGNIDGLRVGKETVKESAGGSECGLMVSGFPPLEVGDQLEFFEAKTKARIL
jgi:translation initiation factor IF-2